VETIAPPQGVNGLPAKPGCDWRQPARSKHCRLMGLPQRRHSFRIRAPPSEDGVAAFHDLDILVPGNAHKAGTTVQLIGMLDSPYVRRVAISLQLLGLHFEHRSISVFRTFEQFRQINPVVKAPSLVCDDGEVLMDSTLIIEFAEALVSGRRSLMPNSLAERQHALRQIGLALAACEKSVSIVYERNLRPPEKLHEPWVSRVTGQLLSAYQLLETELSSRPPVVTSAAINQAGVSIAVAWHFTQQMIPDVVAASKFPILQAFSATAERLPEFLAAPHGDGTYRDSGPV
jgi:glutathione S-transferase